MSPIAAGDLLAITPLGNFNPPGHTFPTSHLYFQVKRTNPNDYNSGPAEVPVYAPGDGWVTSLASSENLTQNRADYTIRFSPCREVEAYFFHVTSITRALKDRLVAPFDWCNEYITGGERYRLCEKTIRDRGLPLVAGQQMGTAGGRPNQNALDFGMYDFRKPALPFANPSRWSDTTRRLVCAIDYFTATTKSALQDKLGDTGGVKRTIPSICGEVAQDVSGTAQGAWFLKGTLMTYPEDPHLALAHDNLNPLKGVFSVGTSTAKSGLASGTYYFDPVASGGVNRDFKDVVPDGKVYCYEPRLRFSNGPTGSIILVQLTLATTLRLERQVPATCGSGPWFFGSTYTDYER